MQWVTLGHVTSNDQTASREPAIDQDGLYGSAVEMSDSAVRVRRLIRTARQAKGWSQAALAREADIKSRTTIQNLENGQTLREGFEGAVERALGLQPGAIAAARADEDSTPTEHGGSGLPDGQGPHGHATGRDDGPHDGPDPADFDSDVAYLEAVYWYQRGLGWSHAAVMLGFRMAASAYLRKYPDAEIRRIVGDG